MNNNMLKGNGLLGGLSNLGPDTKFLGVTLRDNDLRSADIDNLAVCLTGREWDVRVDTSHKLMYYNEHLDGDRALAKGFLQCEDAATFSVQSTFIQPAVDTKEALSGFLRFWDEHN